MSQQTIKFPVFFTLEHAENGYILTYKDETSGLSGESSYKKEVVLEDKIEGRVGKLLCLGALVKEKPVSFYVETAGVKTYKAESETCAADDIIQAKTTYYHMLQKGSKNGEILCLALEDTKTIEVYGYEAERIARNINVIPSRSGGIPYLEFPNGKEGRRMLANCGMATKLVSTTHKQITQWIEEHPAEFVKSTK